MAEMTLERAEELNAGREGSFDFYNTELGSEVEMTLQEAAGCLVEHYPMRVRVPSRVWVVVPIGGEFPRGIKAMRGGWGDYLNVGYVRRKDAEIGLFRRRMLDELSGVSIEYEITRIPKRDVVRACRYVNGGNLEGEAHVYIRRTLPYDKSGGSKWKWAGIDEFPWLPVPLRLKNKEKRWERINEARARGMTVHECHATKTTKALEYSLERQGETGALPPVTLARMRAELEKRNRRKAVTA